MVSSLVVGAALAVGVAGFSPELQQFKRHLEADVVSGTPQEKVTQQGKPERWKRRDVVIAVDSSVDQLGPLAQDAIQRAFGAWLGVGADLPNLTFKSAKGLVASQTPDGVNSVLLAPIDIPGHQNDLAVTIGFADPTTGELVEADIVINSRHPFAVLDQSGYPITDNTSDGDDDPGTDDDDETTPDDETPSTVGEDQAKGALLAQRSATTTSAEAATTTTSASCTGNAAQTRRCGGTYDIENVMTHEAGHFFGLGEDTEDATATMFQCTSPCETHKRAPHPGDVSAMTLAYVDGYKNEQTQAAICSLGSTTQLNSTRNAGSHSVALLAFLATAGTAVSVRRRTARKSG